MADDLPTVLSSSGLQPIDPRVLRDSIVDRAVQLSPGLTANLPGILIEDIASTDVAALQLMDSARIDLVESVTPRGCNAWLLEQLGAIFGVPAKRQINTSVGVVFTGPPGYVIRKGFQVSDGLYAYRIADGGIIGASGQSASLQAIAVDAGAWAVPPNTVTALASSVPSAIVLSCVNPLAGIPGQLSQTETDHRAAVLQAGRASGVGMPAYAKTLLQNVDGVDSRLVSVKQQSGGGWRVIVGGGDPYEVAWAIWRGFTDISQLTGSTLSVTNITTADNGVVTTDLDHNYANGQVVMVNGISAGMVGINGVPLTVTVIDSKRFSTGVSTQLFGNYTSGGYLTPNLRNMVVGIRDYPDVYRVPFIVPPQQLVGITLIYDTSDANFINVGAIEQLGSPAIAQYVNSVAATQPLNVYEMQRAFLDAIASVLPSQLVSELSFAISINGTGVSPTPGTGVIPGDPESYFYTDPNGLGIVIEKAA